MAIEDIFHALEEQADAECDRIVGHAKSQAESIMSEAGRESDEIRSRKVREAEALAEARLSQKLNSARLHHKKEMAGVKGRAVQTVFEGARERLVTVRESDSYPALLEKLVKEALEGVEGEFEVFVDPADEAAVGRAFSAIGMDAPVKTDLTSMGEAIGVVGLGFDLDLV